MLLRQPVYAYLHTISEQVAFFQILTKSELLPITSQVSEDELGAVGMTNKTLSDRTAIDVSGLLVKIWGWVTFEAADGSCIYVDDGSGVRDGSGHSGVMVVLSGLTSPITKGLVVDQYVGITGLAGMANNGTEVVPAIRPRGDSDIGVVTATLDEMTTAHLWVLTNFGPTASRHPFSFTYNNQSSADLLGTWQQSYSETQLGGQRTQRTTTYTDPATGLVVRCVSIEYHDFPAVEWTVYFENTGASDTPILKTIRSLNAEFYGGLDSGDFQLHHADGSTALITDFQPRQTPIAAYSSRSFSPYGGRSSDGVLPFFNLERPDGNGVVIGVGWTGQWSASFQRGGDCCVIVKAGMELTNLKLHPGEEIRSTASLLLFWSGGDYLRGQNQLRRLLLAHYIPNPDYS